MTVFVDDLRRERDGRIWCHMVAESEEELHRFARSLGLKRAWAQKLGTPHAHYDLTVGRRTAALAAGAVALTRRELVAELWRMGHSAQEDTR